MFVFIQFLNFVMRLQLFYVPDEICSVKDCTTALEVANLVWLYHPEDSKFSRPIGVHELHTMTSGNSVYL